MSGGGFVEGDFGRGAGLDEDGASGIRADAIMAGSGVGIGDEGGRVSVSSGEGHRVRNRGRVGSDVHSFQEKEKGFQNI